MLLEKEIEINHKKRRALCCALLSFQNIFQIKVDLLLIFQSYDPGVASEAVQLYGSLPDLSASLEILVSDLPKPSASPGHGE